MNELKWNGLSFSLTDLAVVGLLRFASGFGLGLLLAESIGARNRKRIGWSLFSGSIAAGVPLGIRMLRGHKEHKELHQEHRAEEEYIPARPAAQAQPATGQVAF